MSATEYGYPMVVEPGWVGVDIITRVPDKTFRLLTYADGTVRFEHVCDRSERGVILCAPALRIGNGHTLTRNDTKTRNSPEGEPTVNPSILCPDCGTHGFITEGRWSE